MKSSIGIGALLLDGLGDTIRVSLTEVRSAQPVWSIGPFPVGPLVGPIVHSFVRTAAMVTPRSLSRRPSKPSSRSSVFVSTQPMSEPTDRQTDRVCCMYVRVCISQSSAFLF